MKIYPEIKIAGGLILAFTLVVTACVFAYFNSTKAIESGRSVSNGLELLATLESLFEVVLSTDRLSIEYVQTGNEKTLEQFINTARIAQRHMEYVKGLAAQDDHRYKQLLEMEAKVKTAVDRASEIVEARKRAGTALVLPQSYRDKQQSLLDYIRGRILYMESEERVSISKNNKAYAERTDNLYKTYAVLGVLTAAFFLGLLFTLVKYIGGERRIAEAERRVGDEIVAHAPIGVLILDESLNVVSANPGLSRFLGLAESENITGRPLSSLLPALPEPTIQALDNLRSGENFDMQSLQLHELMLLPEKYCDIAIWPVMDKANLKGVIFLIVDISERVGLQKQRHLLFNTFAHDLKNPILGNQYLLKALLQGEDDRGDSSRRPVLEELEHGNEDALKMIMNILEIAKLQMGGESTPRRMETFNLKELIEEIIFELNRISRSRNIDVTCDFPEQAVEICADRVALKHLVLNLLENAIKFSDNAGKVEVKVIDAQPHFCSFSVHNEGPPLSEWERKNVFTNIGQGERGRRSPGGSGIGMYLCAQLVANLGGTINCPDEEHGTTFVVSIPLRHDTDAGALKHAELELKGQDR